jgi:hypothetical protein
MRARTAIRVTAVVSACAAVFVACLFACGGQAEEKLGSFIIPKRKCVTWTTSTTWTAPSDVSSLDVWGYGGAGGGGYGGSGIVNAGGGAGGAGGGGAPGAVPVAATLAVTPGAVYQVTIGAGGVGGVAPSTLPTSGGNSAFAVADGGSTLWLWFGGMYGSPGISANGTSAKGTSSIVQPAGFTGPVSVLYAPVFDAGLSSFGNQYPGAGGICGISGGANANGAAFGVSLGGFFATPFAGSAIPTITAMSASGGTGDGGGGGGFGGSGGLNPWAVSANQAQGGNGGNGTTSADGGNGTGGSGFDGGNSGNGGAGGGGGGGCTTCTGAGIGGAGGNGDNGLLRGCYLTATNM